MTSPLIPETYEQWHHCITVICRQPLTPEFVDKRIKALNDPKEHTTQRFVQLYGDQQRIRTIQWFEQSKAELASK